MKGPQAILFSIFIIILLLLDADMHCGIFYMESKQ